MSKGFVKVTLTQTVKDIRQAWKEFHLDLITKEELFSRLDAIQKNVYEKENFQ